MKINGSKQYRKYTTKGNARGGNHASLYYSVLLPRKGLLEKSRLFKKLCPGLDKKEAQKASRDIEGRYCWWEKPLVVALISVVGDSAPPVERWCS